MIDVELQDAVTLAEELRDPFGHHCPAVDARVDSQDSRLLDCRCFESAEFLAAKDSIAVALDARRTTKDK